MQYSAGRSLWVESLDGTRIGYTVHHGKQPDLPGIILIECAMATCEAYTALAKQLTTDFTVYTPDRRGRGMSPKPYDSSHSIARDVEDIDALLRATGAKYVFGWSSGAVVTLEAVRTLPSIEKAIVYEPPFYPPFSSTDGTTDTVQLEVTPPLSHAGIRKLNEQIERCDWAPALITSLAVAQTAPPFMLKLPAPVLRLLATVVLNVEWWWNHKTKPTATFYSLLPGIRYDFKAITEMDGRTDMFRTVKQPVLLLNGTSSQAFLKNSVLHLQSIMPHSTRIELDGADHGGPAEKPEAVAAAIKAFVQSAD